MIGKLGRSLRSQRKMCRLSASPRGKSSRSRSGVTPACTNSIASQPLPTVSSCQEFVSPIDPSERTTVGSLLTTSRRTASIAFSVTGLKFLWEIPRETRCKNSKGVRRRILECERLEISELRRSKPPMCCRHFAPAEYLRRRPESRHALARAARSEEMDGRSTGICCPIRVRTASICDSAIGVPSPRSPTNLNTPSMRSTRNRSSPVGAQFHKHITTKQRQFHGFPPVAPAMHFGDQRQESVDSLFAQPVGDDSFMSGASMHGIPLFNIGCHDW